MSFVISPTGHLAEEGTGPQRMGPKERCGSTDTRSKVGCVIHGSEPAEDGHRNAAHFVLFHPFLSIQLRECLRSTVADVHPQRLTLEFIRSILIHMDRGRVPVAFPQDVIDHLEARGVRGDDARRKYETLDSRHARCSTDSSQDRVLCLLNQVRPFKRGKRDMHDSICTRERRLVLLLAAQIVQRDELELRQVDTQFGVAVFELFGLGDIADGASNTRCPACKAERPTCEAM